LRKDTRSTPSIECGVQSMGLQNTPVEQSSPASLKREGGCSTLSVPLLAAQCLKEIDNFHRGEPCTDTYGVELVRRATMQEDQEAWAWMQHCFGGVVRSWLRGHPSRETACRLESEENYVALAFERFWQATTLTQHVEFNTLAAVLRYLRASLNGAIVDMLRAYARPREVPLPKSGAREEPHVQDTNDSSELWEILQTMLPNMREQRVAYLLFHGGLGPREIVRFCPQEFPDVHEIYRLRRSILERLLRNADQLRWRLTMIEGDQWGRDEHIVQEKNTPITHSLSQ
jgi:hypothetical protein